MNLPSSLLVISPHLDDAVLSCGQLLAARPASTVCTVFTSAPHAEMTTPWDRDSGFANASEAVRARKAEDLRALCKLGASAIHLPFYDAQYQFPQTQQALIPVLIETFNLVRPDALVVPLGLFHSDHTLVADACLASMSGFANTPVFAYEDVPYRKMTGILQNRLALLLQRGFMADPMDTTSLDNNARHRLRKQAALASYASQLRAFGPGGRTALDSPERYWRVATNGTPPGSTQVRI
jgi:LmbE family N-acetylglucosaminyl deacetylase